MHTITKTEKSNPRDMIQCKSIKYLNDHTHERLNLVTLCVSLFASIKFFFVSSLITRQPPKTDTFIWGYSSRVIFVTDKLCYQALREIPKNSCHLANP